MKDRAEYLKNSSPGDTPNFKNADFRRSRQGKRSRGAIMKWKAFPNLRC